MKRGIDRAVDVVIKSLVEQTRAVSSKEEITQGMLCPLVTQATGASRSLCFFLRQPSIFLLRHVLECACLPLFGV